MTRCTIAATVVSLLSSATFAGQSRAVAGGQNAPTSLIELPPDVPADALRYTVLMMGNKAGVNVVWRTPDGASQAFFAFNDRGRGPRIRETWRTTPDGILRSFELTGNDYLKTPVTETLSVSGEHFRWSNQAEHAEKGVSPPALYVPMNGGPVDSALIVKAAQAHGGTIALLPDGQATVRKVAQKEFTTGDRHEAATLYAIAGLDLTPSYIWVDRNTNLFAAGGSWLMTVREGWEAITGQIIDVQQQTDRTRSAALASQLAHRPGDAVALRNVNVFDSAAARIVPSQTVVVRGKTIESVGSSDRVVVPPAALSVDGAGKTLLPGLWDMHAHVGANDGLLNLAAGVTAVRDLANDTDELEARRQRIDAGSEIGTRIFPAGFIDGPGPFQGPTKALADNEEQARGYVRKYASLGYRQIKIYSSLKPALVPAIIDEAHRHGMRVSGHIPAGMTAADGVRAGMDEIQHVNFLMLNFMPDVTDKTMTPARFTEVAKRAADIDISSPAVQDFIALLKERQVAIDPTLAIFEEMFVNRAGHVPESYESVAGRLPAQFRRNLLTGGLPVPEGMDARYKDSFNNMMKLVKAMYDAGIPVESGTDSLAGFTLERELELHVKAGIPAAQVLADATLGAARIVKVDDALGSIAEGKLADLVLIDGNPVNNISDIRRPTLVMKDGVIYYPPELHRELGIAPAR